MTSGDFLAGKFPATDTFSVWTWDDLKRSPLTFPKWNVACTYSGDILTGGHDDRSLSLKNLGRTQDTPLIKLKRERYFDNFQSSRNGKYIAVLCDDNLSASGNFGHAEKPIGLYRAEEKKFEWIQTIKSDAPRGIRIHVSNIVVSDDGRSIALVGYNGRGGWVNLTDCAAKGTKWEDTPKGSVAFYGGDFSADDETLFVGGGVDGKIYRYGVSSGRLLGSDWEVRERINRIAASPDGRIVAVGTGPMGVVYLLDARDGTVIRILRTQDGTISGLAFSPDGKLLATGGARLRIFRMPGAAEEKEAKEQTK